MERERVKKRLGTGECYLCGSPNVLFTQTETGWITSVCSPYSGGCNTQQFYRYEQASEAAARRFIKKWDRPEDRTRILGIEPGRHVDAADQAPKAEPEAIGKALSNWWNKEDDE